MARWAKIPDHYCLPVTKQRVLVWSEKNGVREGFVDFAGWVSWCGFNEPWTHWREMPEGPTV